MSNSTTEAPVCRMVKPERDLEADDMDETERPQSKTYRRVAICGTSETTRHLAPHAAVDKDGNPLWEIWTLGTSNKLFPRQTRHFQLHDLEHGAQRWSDEYKLWLSTAKIPVFVQRKHEWIPNGIEYPLGDICAALPSGDYLTSQIALMIVMAIYEGVDEIGIYGCDLAHDAEYAYQRPCVEHWLGFARGRGIKVHIPRESDLLKCAEIYAYETHGGMYQSGASSCLLQRSLEIEARLAQHKAKYEEHQRAYFILQGAHESHRYWRHWFGMDHSHTGRDYVMEETTIHKSDGKP